MFRMGRLRVVRCCCESAILFPLYKNYANFQHPPQTLIITMISVARHAVNYRVRDEQRQIIVSQRHFGLSFVFDNTLSSSEYCTCPPFMQSFPSSLTVSSVHTRAFLVSLNYWLCGKLIQRLLVTTNWLKSVRIRETLLDILQLISDTTS